jgi:type II secretory pathway component PulF
VTTMSRAAVSSGDVQGTKVRPVRPYLYEAAKPGGGRTMGFVRARDQRDLTTQLRSQKLVPLRSWTLPAIGGGTQTAAAVSLKDQAELHTQLAQLLTRGVPLVEALDVCSQAVSAGMKPRVTKMKELVAAGSSFSDALVSIGGFDGVTVSVYRAAERTGDLGGAAKQLSTTVRRQVAIRGKAVTLMLYPLIVLTISLIVSVGMMTLVVPRIIESLKQSMSEMPWFSELVYFVGVTLRDNFLMIFAGLMVLVVLAFIFRAAVGRFLAGVMRRLPFMRDVVMAQECARFFTVMSAMTKTGVVLADALAVAEGAVSHPQLRRELTRLRTRLIEGGVLRVLIDEVKTLPLPSRRLLIAAERSGDLQQAFDTLASDMADEVDKQSQRLLAVLEPAMIILMFLMIGTLVLSIMVPLISLTSRVQGV